jgi:hypothetical protein
MDIYKDLLKNDLNFNDLINNKNKSKFYLPLIGSNALSQKTIIDDENCIKIKLKKIRRFRNKSQNFEQFSLKRGNLII